MATEKAAVRARVVEEPAGGKLQGFLCAVGSADGDMGPARFVLVAAPDVDKARALARAEVGEGEEAPVLEEAFGDRGAVHILRGAGMDALDQQDAREGRPAPAKRTDAE